MRARIVLLLILLTGLWGVMLGRAAFLQLLPNERLKALQKRQFETVVTLNPRRGDVLDRNGHELAVSMSSYSLFADPKLIEEPKKTARRLAHELKLPLKQIEDKLKSRRKRFVWIDRQLSKPVHDAINEMKIRGLGFIEESRRIYPNDHLLSQVLGVVGGEGQGLEGLELKYNESLQASAKKLSVHRDARGRPLIVNGQVFDQAPDGADLQLTIDRELQFILEQELAGAVREHEADSAVGVVLDAQTSEILAMASSPTFDANRAGEFGPERKRNRAVVDSFEPGSTIKTFVIAGALADGLIEPNTKFNCENGAFKIGKRTIHEAEAKEKFGDLTVSEILAFSSNVGASKIAFKLGPEKLAEAIHRFGFGERTGVDLPGEAKGILQPQPWKDIQMATISFGQGMTVTPLQMANAFAAIANGGYLKTPSIVKSIRDHESGETLEMKPKIVRQVLTPEQVAKMRIMLTGVTTDGTGTTARVPGFPVAGKTGTAQKVNPNGRGYMKGGYIASFGGFLPANDPRFVIYVAIDHPRKGYYGGAVAGPVFSRIAKFAVRRAGLAPVLINETNMVPQARRAPPEPSRPVAKTLQETPEKSPDQAAEKDLQLADLEPVAIEPPPAPAAPGVDAVMPDLTGLTLREVIARVGAIDTASAAGLAASGAGRGLHVHGQGFVTHTLPLPGTKLAEHQELNIFLSQ